MVLVSWRRYSTDIVRLAWYTGFYSARPGSEVYVSIFGKELHESLGTRLKFSTAIHPQTDGQSEDHSDLWKIFRRAYALEWTGSWDEYCACEFAYKNSWHASIKAAPFRAFVCWRSCILKFSAVQKELNVLDQGQAQSWTRFIGPLRFWNRLEEVRSRGSDFDIPVVFSLIIALLRNKILHYDQLNPAMLTLIFEPFEFEPLICKH
ncbi:putative nucleotidyltransferase, ribonuclease H [Tanacetum coccineum]